MKTKKYNEPFIGFIIDEKDYSYEIHLVNPTDKNFSRVFSLTGAFCGDDDGLLETSRATREKGILPSHSSILLEKSDLDGLDFVIWFHLDLYEKEGGRPKKVCFYLPKYHWTCENEKLPVIEKKGIFIKLKTRIGYKTIEREVKTMNMDGGYHKSANS